MPIFAKTELQTAFETARDEIAAVVEKGVKPFQLGEQLCLVTDWSQTGMGYVLSQRHCTCQKLAPGCCKDGWVVVAVVSRFCTAAESRYAPIQGELLLKQDLRR